MPISWAGGGGELFRKAVTEGVKELERRMELANKPCTKHEDGEHVWHHKLGTDGKTPVYWCQCLAIR